VKSPLLPAVKSEDNLKFETKMLEIFSRFKWTHYQYYWRIEAIVVVVVLDNERLLFNGSNLMKPCTVQSLKDWKLDKAIQSLILIIRSWCK